MGSNFYRRTVTNSYPAHHSFSKILRFIKIRLNYGYIFCSYTPLPSKNIFRGCINHLSPQKHGVKVSVYLLNGCDLTEGQLGSVGLLCSNQRVNLAGLGFRPLVAWALVCSVYNPYGAQGVGAVTTWGKLSPCLAAMQAGNVTQ